MKLLQMLMGGAGGAGNFPPQSLINPSTPGGLTPDPMTPSPMMTPPPPPTMPMSQILSPFDTGSRGAGMGAMPASMPASMPPAGGGGPTNIVPPGMGAAPSAGAAGMDPAKMAALQALVEPEQEEPLSPPGAPSRPQIDPGMLFEALMKMGISPAQIPQLSSILRRQ